jgi:outer membrane protein TolC
MRSINLICLPVVLAIVSGLTGCTVHPPGEQEERDAALKAGKPFEKRIEARQLSPLLGNPTPDQLVEYALLSNADLEQHYWEWRGAIEQIPIDGTQPTSLAISLGTTTHNGSLAFDRTTLTVANDPMTDIAFPGKLSTAARRSLENARAAGMRFRKAQFEIRHRVLTAYDDCALTATLIRLGEQNVQLLQTIAMITEARNQSGSAGQQDVLKADNELDLAKNDLQTMRSQLPSQRAVLNALLDRSPTAAIAVPETLPPARPLAESDQDLLDRAAKMNLELAALADEVRAKHENIHLARLQYFPDFDLAASTDLKAVTQALMGEFTVPILRDEALRAGVQQAEANLRAAEAMRRQTKENIAAELVDDIATLRDADRQLDLLEHTILPRAQQIITLGRAAYQTGGKPLIDLLDSQRSLIDIERLQANLRVIRDKRLAEIESVDLLKL